VQKATLTLFGTVVYKLGTAVPCIVTPAARRRVVLSLPRLLIPCLGRFGTYYRLLQSQQKSSK